MVGVDKKGTSGTAGSVDNHYDKVALGLLLTTSLGAGVRMSQGKYDPHSASIGQELGNTLAQETARLYILCRNRAKRKKVCDWLNRPTCKKTAASKALRLDRHGGP
jgi:hypothetical protein